MTGRPKRIGAGLLLLAVLLGAVGMIGGCRNARPSLQRERAEQEPKARVKAKLQGDEKEVDRVCAEKATDDPCYLSLAERGNSSAQYLVGYYLIWKDEGNFSAAIPWLEKAANQGHIEAMKELGSIYSLGNYRKNFLKSKPERRYDSLIDGKKALMWYRTAADLGDNDAMWYVGGIYEDGRFATQNYAEALNWYKRAADAGNDASTLSLAELFERGRDNNEAYKWYCIWCAAAEVGDCFERDAVAKKLSPADVVKAQELASKWMAKFRK